MILWQTFFNKVWQSLFFNTHQTFFFLFLSYIKLLFHLLKYWYVYFFKNLLIKLYQNIIFILYMVDKLMRMAYQIPRYKSRHLNEIKHWITYNCKGSITLINKFYGQTVILYMVVIFNFKGTIWDKIGHKTENIKMNIYSHI